MIELTIRLVFSLAVVIGLLLVIARLGSRRFKGRHGSLVRVVHRQPLSRTSSVSVVTVGSRVLVIGTTEHQVSMLTELDPDELEVEELEAALAASPDAPADTPAEGRKKGDAVPADVDSRLAGSLLSATTWRQALAAARRTS